MFQVNQTPLLSFLERPSSTSKIALIEDNKKISYQQLKQQVEHISAALKSRHPNCRRIVIFLERGIDATLVIMATLNIGACYIPVDTKNPINRLSFIINDVDAQCVIGKGNCPVWIKKNGFWLDFESLDIAKITTVQPVEVTKESLAGILYTSGSTGNPKGIALSHRAMQNFSDWAGNTFNIKENDQIASLAPFHFDLSVFDLFTSLNQGATIHFVPGHLTLSPSRLTQWLSEHKISVWYTVPSILGFIEHKGALAEINMSHLQTILFAGEVFPTQALIKLCQLLPQVNFYNLYGPTETNVCCYWPVDRNQLHNNQPIPIGIAACNSRLRIDSKTGELQVKSENNLSGYWQQGELIPALSADNYFNTGDKVSLNDKGEFCYHGRLDRMIKCSGYRVEPAEIEQLIQQMPEVEQCVVVGIKDIASGQRPAAALVLKKNATLTDIIRPLKQKLPGYMQPSKFLVLDSLPTLSNGKIDLQTLQKQLEN
jgi:amino acid adenylation domain-containing protein